MRLPNRLLVGVAALLLINSGYLIAARGATLFHAAQILLHPVLGIAALKLILWGWKTIAPALRSDPLRRWFWISGGLLAVSGLGLFVFGALPETRPPCSTSTSPAPPGSRGCSRGGGYCSLRSCWPLPFPREGFFDLCCPIRDPC